MPASTPELQASGLRITGKVIAVNARRTTKAKVRKVIVLGSTSVTVAAGQSKTVKVSLNRFKAGAKRH